MDGHERRLPSGPLGFLSGVLSVFRGAHRIFSEPALRRLAIVPLLLTTIVYAALFVLSIVYADDVLSRVWPEPTSGLLRLLWWLLVPVVFAAMFVPVLMLFSTLAEAIGGPFYDKMAIRVLLAHGALGKAREGKPPSVAPDVGSNPGLERSSPELPRDPGFLRGTLPDVLRSLAFLLAGSVCALLALIPGIGVFFAALGTVIACLGFASAAFNSALMVTGVGLRRRLSFPFREPFLAAGVGSIVALSLFVPLLGLISIPSAVVGATDLYARALREPD